MKIFRNASLYLFFNVINQAIPFFLLPILTHHIAPESYGSLTDFNVFYAFLVPFIHLALYTNIQRTYFKQGKEETAILIFNIQMVAIAATFMMLLGIFFFQDSLSERFLLNGWILAAIPIVSLLSIYQQYLFIILRNEEKVYHFGIFQIAFTAINFSLSLLLVIGWEMDWYGRVYAILFASGVIGLASFIYLLYYGFIKVKLDGQLIKKCLIIALPLVPSALAGTTINLSDRIFIGEMTDKATLGIYSAGYSLGMIMSFLVVAFNFALRPWIFKQLQTATSDNIASTNYKLARFTWLYTGLILILAIMVTIGCHFLIYLGFLPAAYAPAKQYILWVTLAYSCYGILLMIFPYLAHSGKTTYYFPLSVFAAVLNLLCNYYFIQWYGALGAAYATLIAYFVLLLGAWIYSNKVYPMPWFSRQTWTFNYHNIRTLFEEN